MRLTTAKKAGFQKKGLRKRKEQRHSSALGYMKEKSSFLIAAFSLAAFVSGNMLGQHGWYAFWKAALGQYDDSLITYSGTVTPVAYVPDYTRWSQYGGNGEEHTYRQVPRDLLIPLPTYNQRTEQKDYDHSPEGDVYSIGNMGSYETGAENDGSHIGVDIRVPVGTPIRSIANGIVERVANDASGFGLLIVIRHPHAPDPDNPEYENVLHSAYAHLSAQYVQEGDVVQKGQEIGLSGKTGFATGPHLHFQVDRDEAPWHPYWAFSYSEARAVGMNTTQAINAGLHQERGYEYTVHPMLYVQANYSVPKYKIEPGKTVAHVTTTRTTTVTRTSTRRVVTAQTMEEARAARLQERLAARKSTTTVAVTPPAQPAQTDVVKTETVASEQIVVQKDPAPVLVVPSSNDAVSSVDIQHDRYFSGREWESVRLTLKDANGNTVNEKNWTGKLYMRTAYGDAEFNPSVLSASDFSNGTATIKMLPRGRRTVVILVEPLKSMSRPMEYQD